MLIQKDITDDIDVNKILVSKKEPYGTKKALKYFLGYNDNDVIRPFCLRLPQMTGYAKKFDENITMSLRVNNNANNNNNNNNAGSVITNFHNKKVSKEKTPCKCLSIIMLDSVIKANKKYYPQTLLEECKDTQEKINYIDDNLEESDSNDETKSDNDNDGEDGEDEK